MERLKSHITVLCLTIISLADYIFAKGEGGSVFLWFGYTLYRLHLQDKK